MEPIFYASYVALWLLVMVQGVLLLLVYRHFGFAAMGTAEGIQRDGLAIGEVAPGVSGVTPQGKDMRWEPALGRTYLVLFATPNCEPCEQILPTISQLAMSVGAELDGLIVTPGQHDAAAQIAEKFRLPFECLAEDGSGAFNNYRVRVTPFAFVVGSDRRIRAKGLCSDLFRLRDLFVAGGMESIAKQVPIPVSEGPALKKVG